MFRPVFSLKSFILNCFSKCNIHFQSVLICWVLTAENITKISHSKLKAFKATLFEPLNKAFLTKIILITGKSNILNNNYKTYHVKCQWFWFWLVFVPSQIEQFSVAWLRIWMSAYHLGLTLAIAH